jgi:hypothetical protein
MKVSKPPFSAASASQVTSSDSREIGLPSVSVIRTPPASISTISPFSIGTAVLVSARKAGIAEARKVSPSPTPATRGHSLRAPSRRSGSSACMATKA